MNISKQVNYVPATLRHTLKIEKRTNTPTVYYTYILIHSPCATTPVSVHEITESNRDMIINHHVSKEYKLLNFESQNLNNRTHYTNQTDVGAWKLINSSMNMHMTSSSWDSSGYTQQIDINLEQGFDTQLTGIFHDTPDTPDGILWTEDKATVRKNIVFDNTQKIFRASDNFVRKLYHANFLHHPTVSIKSLQDNSTSITNTLKKQSNNFYKIVDRTYPEESRALYEQISDTNFATTATKIKIKGDHSFLLDCETSYLYKPYVSSTNNVYSVLST